MLSWDGKRFIQNFYQLLANFEIFSITQLQIWEKLSLKIPLIFVSWATLIATVVRINLLAVLLSTWMHRFRVSQFDSIDSVNSSTQCCRPNIKIGNLLPNADIYSVHNVWYSFMQQQQQQQHSVKGGKLIGISIDTIYVSVWEWYFSSHFFFFFSFFAVVFANSHFTRR